MSEYLFAGMDSYDTPEGHPVSLGFRMMFRSRWYFYFHNFGIFIRSGRLASRGKLDKENQIRLSSENIELIENCGTRIHLRGLFHLRDLHDRPVVIVGNHMSLLETAVMHAIIREYVDFSFVVKNSLLRTPYMKDILNTIGAIGLTRENPREDLKAVLTEGKRILQSGRSMIVFPQATRTRVFDREQFNSIGVKLAKSAGVPVVPMALKTDMLESGRILRDLGPIFPERDVRFEFGPAMEIEGTGQAQQQAIEEFITAAFARWQSEEREKR